MVQSDLVSRYRPDHKGCILWAGYPKKETPATSLYHQATVSLGAASVVANLFPLSVTGRSGPVWRHSLDSRPIRYAVAKMQCSDLLNLSNHSTQPPELAPRLPAMIEHSCRYQSRHHCCAYPLLHDQGDYLFLSTPPKL
jgi:hypothetical protein